MTNFEVLNSQPEIGARSQPKIRLAFLDGMRGLTAFYVVLVHLYREIVCS
ncbi:hypothetical protein [Stenomitos frigidus]|nr:hypothetical protein [Stenomitos frigidus]